MDFNFDQMNADASNASQNSGTGEQIYLKVKQGAHRLRIVPQGNETEKLPYLKIQQHSLRLTDEQGNTNFRYVMCWNYVFEKFKIIGEYLARTQKLTREDAQLYKSFGCPFCRAMHALDTAGIAKTEARDLAPKVSFTFNVVVRENGTNSIVKVWSTSNKVFDSIMTVFKMYRDMNLNLFDANNGYDLALQAAGERLQRRYTVNVIPQPVPIGLAEGTLTHNLIEIACRNFYSYSDTIAFLKKGYHNKLAAINYVIPGDDVGAMLAKSAGDLLGVPLQAANTNNGIFTSAESKADVFDNIMPVSVPVPTKPTAPAGATMLNDGGWVHAGVLYKADGSPAF